MPKLRIDNREVEVAAGTTLLAAAAKLGIRIPALCHLEGCDAQTSCLVCLVKVNGGSRLVPSCATVAVEGMVVESETAEVRSFRKAAIELLLAEHAGDCYAPCENVCPAHMDIPTMMRNIEAGDLRAAVATVKKAIPLPATLGRICPELCEKGCRRASRDDSVSICSLKRYVGDKDLAKGGGNSPYLPECKPASGKSVAIVGSGPAGLTAAWFLRQNGHAVTLFDDHPLPGGALRYAIAEELLPRATLNAEIDLIRALGSGEGVTFVMNTRVDAGKMAELKRDFDAILLAAGPVDQEKAAALGADYVGKGIKVDRKTLQTQEPKVFAAGSALIPLQHAIRAVADGKNAAKHMHAFLIAEAREQGGGGEFASRMGRLTDAEMDRFFAETPTFPREIPHRGGGGGTKDGLSDSQAVREASRCAHCDCSKLDSCRLHDVAMSYQANPARYRGTRREFQRQSVHPLIVYESGKCILCGLCVAIASRAAEPLGLTFIGRGFNVKVGVPLNAEFSKALERVARECVAACPSGALDLRYDAPAERDANPPIRLSLPQLRT
ncbi:MAG: 2Fe-2S iron-sulfur cluster-binding protein [Phycisphaerales bacterium]|nr:2Fe-2S iron-sulfur cluster-binding protein [Phycisphaerales bacterium]